MPIILLVLVVSSQGSICDGMGCSSAHIMDCWLIWRVENKAEWFSNCLIHCYPDIIFSGKALHITGYWALTTLLAKFQRWLHSKCDQMPEWPACPPDLSHYMSNSKENMMKTPTSWASEIMSKTRELSFYSKSSWQLTSLTLKCPPLFCLTQLSLPVVDHPNFFETCCWPQVWNDHKYPYCKNTKNPLSTTDTEQVCCLYYLRIIAFIFYLFTVWTSTNLICNMATFVLFYKQA